MTRIGPRTLAVLVLGALLGALAAPGVGLAGADDRPGAGGPDGGDSTETGPVATTTAAERGGPVAVSRKSGVEIRFACDEVLVSVPGDTPYSLVVHYFVPASGEYGRGLVGPLTGTVAEPFDDEVTFFEVNVLVGGTVVASGFIPESCPNAPGITLADPGSVPTLPPDGDKS